MNLILTIAKAISEQNRLRVICVLRGRELCACDITRMLGLAQATVSRHMSLLVQAGLVLGRKEGRWTHYRLPQKSDGLSPEISEALDWVHAYTLSAPEIQADEHFVVVNDKENEGKCGC